MTKTPSNSLGVNLGSSIAADSYQNGGSSFALGDKIVAGGGGGDWVFCVAATDLAVGNVVGVDKNYLATKITKAIADAGTWVAVCPIAVTSGDYFWAQFTGVIANMLVKASCAADAQLFTSATAGYLDDAAASQTPISGLKLTAARGGTDGVAAAFGYAAGAVSDVAVSNLLGLNNTWTGTNAFAAVTTTTLSATGAVALSPASANVVLSPTGTGVVTVNPTTAGTLDNVAIGGSTPLAGSFTTLAASGASALAAVTATSVTASGYFDRSVGNALTAVGTNRATALQLAKEVNNVTTAGAGTGVILPVGVVGMRISVFNGGANAAQVYASGSETIDTVAGSTGVPLTNTKRADFFFVATNTWISAQLGVVSA